MKHFIFPLFILIIGCDSSHIEPENKLQIGNSEIFIVNAEERLNSTGFEISANENYTFTSSGQWTDLNTICDANGYSDSSLDPFSHLKRDTTALWFELIATADTINFYAIGVDTTITFNESGKLYFFANDAEGFYGNNSGNLSTTVTRNF